ncbi:MAG TPA: hypothetical protein VJ870_06815 [Amycolatopsis sp.]|nr:hypothetical protein [Amycolatopsis sp.]
MNWGPLVSWQEELRKLDEELASGRLSADDYRARRDQVLSSAVGQPDTQQSPPPQQQASGPSADSTQIIAPISPSQGLPQPLADTSAERTQAVPPWQQPQQQQPVDPGRTEYVAAPHQQAPYSPPGGFPQAGPASPAVGFPQAAPWNAPESDQSPPWGAGDLPPLVPSGGSEWALQGPEAFDDKPKKGNGAKIGAIVAAVVVLAGVAFGAYVLWGRDSGGGTAAPTTQAAPASSASPAAPDPMGVADIPGTAEFHDDITTFSQVPGLTYLNSDELSAYETAQPSDVKFVVHNLPDGSRAIMMLVKVNSPAAAQNAVSQLLAIQVRNGGTRLTDVPAGVLASGIDSKNGQPAQVRGHYAHHNVVVRLEVVSPNGLQPAETNFNSVLAGELQKLPADG